MKVLFRPHAVDRMAQRDLAAEDVEDVISAPDGKIKQTKDKYIFYKAIKGRKDNLIAAVVVKSGQDYEVITVLVNFEVHHDS